jgi:CheY-like chemotaxis protein
MSLRVLLADESSTIKRVMQLALQDYGVEVKAVPVGLDVVQVAADFRPDIVFADVLLAKKNGYEVAAELKSHPDLKQVPVVLMWSGFMELDEQKAKASLADQRLEKPFEAETLRQIVRDLVPAAQDNAIASYLSFPNLPPILEDPQAAPISIADSATTDEAPAAAIPLPPSVVEFGADEDEAEEFEQVQLQPQTATTRKENAPTGSPKSEDWSRQDLNQFKIDLPKEAFTVDEADLTHTSIALSSGVEEISLEDLEELETSKKPAPPSAPTAMRSPPKTPVTSSPQLNASLAALDPMHVEEILRQEVRSVLEQIAWKIIPDVAERVVREELQKLLKDAERL